MASTTPPTWIQPLALAQNGVTSADILCVPGSLAKIDLFSSVKTLANQFPDKSYQYIYLLPTPTDVLNFITLIKCSPAAGSFGIVYSLRSSGEIRGDLSPAIAPAQTHPPAPAFGLGCFLVTTFEQLPFILRSPHIQQLFGTKIIFFCDPGASSNPVQVQIGQALLIDWVTQQALQPQQPGVSLSFNLIFLSTIQYQPWIQTVLGPRLGNLYSHFRLRQDHHALATSLAPHSDEYFRTNLPPGGQARALSIMIQNILDNDKQAHMVEENLRRVISQGYADSGYLSDDAAIPGPSQSTLPHPLILCAVDLKDFDEAIALIDSKRYPEAQVAKASLFSDYSMATHNTGSHLPLEPVTRVQPTKDAAVVFQYPPSLGVMLPVEHITHIIVPNHKWVPIFNPRLKETVMTWTHLTQQELAHTEGLLVRHPGSPDTQEIKRYILGSQDEWARAPVSRSIAETADISTFAFELTRHWPDKQPHQIPIPPPAMQPYCEGLRRLEETKIIKAISVNSMGYKLSDRAHVIGPPCSEFVDFGAISIQYFRGAGRSERMVRTLARIAAIQAYGINRFMRFDPIAAAARPRAVNLTACLQGYGRGLTRSLIPKGSLWVALSYYELLAKAITEPPRTLPRFIPCAEGILTIDRAIFQRMHKLVAHFERQWAVQPVVDWHTQPQLNGFETVHLEKLLVLANLFNLVECPASRPGTMRHLVSGKQLVQDPNDVFSVRDFFRAAGVRGRFFALHFGSLRQPVDELGSDLPVVAENIVPVSVPALIGAFRELRSAYGKGGLDPVGVLKMLPHVLLAPNHAVGADVTAEWTLGGAVSYDWSVDEMMTG